jgi:hypothetical protein
MKNIRVSKPFLLSISALLLFLNLGYASEAPTFKSKLFKSGNLLISMILIMGNIRAGTARIKKM